MLEKPPSKDEALEALDFIVSVLKEHEKDLDKLICGLGIVAGQLGETGEFRGKLEKIEEKLDSLQAGVGNLIKCFASQPREKAAIQTGATEDLQNDASQAKTSNMLAVIMHCEQWEDFQLLATQAHTISFICKDNEKKFEANALKDNKIVTYSGELPKFSEALRTWLSKQLDVSEERVWEGYIALG